MAQKVSEWRAGDGDVQLIAPGEVGLHRFARPMHLGEEDFLVRAGGRTPLANAPLQRTSLAAIAGQSSSKGSSRVRHERGCFSSEGNFPTSRYLAAVFGSIPARAAAMPSLPCLLNSSISFLTCASVAATQTLLVWAASCYGVTQDREK